MDSTLPPPADPRPGGHVLDPVLAHAEPAQAIPLPLCAWCGEPVNEARNRCDDCDPVKKYT